jgi:hypothetical protein
MRTPTKKRSKSTAKPGRRKGVRPSIEDKLRKLGGTAVARSEIDMLRERIPAAPPELLSRLERLPLAGATISVDDDDDASGLGVEMKWMTPADMVDEATNFYPGIVALPRGYIPIGICLQGSGDPYFFRQRDGSVVRIPHDAATEEDLDEEQIEVVADSVEKLLTMAE